MKEEHCNKWGLDSAKLPRHVGIIMDGNGRWATGQRLPRIAGHRKGVDRVSEIVEMGGNIGLGALTLFAFSDENWRRPEDEVGALMNLIRLYVRKEKRRLIEENVQFRMIGDRKKISRDIVNLIEDVEVATEHNTGMCLNIALSYGSRGEILRAARRIAARATQGELFAEDIDESVFEDHLDTRGLPPVDLIIRTSGEYRVSNFLLWQLAYAELFFERTMWPDFDSRRFATVLKEYAQRERRFGLTSEQVTKANLSTVRA